MMTILRAPTAPRACHFLPADAASARAMRDESAPDLAALMRKVAETADRAAFAALFSHVGPRLKSYLLRLGSPDAEAEDLLQDVMVTLWHKAADFDPTRASVNTWLFTIARNKRIDRLRRDKHIDWDADDPALTPDAAVDQAPSADQAYALAQQSDRLRAAIALLPPEQADLLHLAYWDDRSHSDIATTANLPLGTVKSRLRLALARLRAVLKDIE